MMIDFNVVGLSGFRGVFLIVLFIYVIGDR